MNFYEELIQSIEKLIDEKKYEEARAKIIDELSMPYVPNDIYETLESFMDKLEELVPSKGDSLSDEDIIEYLKSDDRSLQLIAVNYLDRMNLREYLDIVSEFLVSSNGDDEVKTMLISSLINQEIGEEIKVDKSGMEYEFIPKYVMSVEESDGYLRAVVRFDEVLFKNPTYYNLAIELFTKEAYRALPVNIDDDEALVMADNIIRHIYRLFEDEEALNEFRSISNEQIILN